MCSIILYIQTEWWYSSVSGVTGVSSCIATLDLQRALMLQIIDAPTPTVMHIRDFLIGWGGREDQHVCVLLVRMKFGAEAGREAAEAAEAAAAPANTPRDLRAFTGECSRAARESTRGASRSVARSVLSSVITPHTVLRGRVWSSHAHQGRFKSRAITW